MRIYVFIFLYQWIIFLDQYKFTTGKAIVGENVRRAREREFDFVVSIMRITKNPNPEMDHQCTGTLITNRNVLTNDHCVNFYPMKYIQVIVGSISLSGGTKYYPLWWKTYNEWSDKKYNNPDDEINDVAVIRLSKNVSEAIIPPIISTKSHSELYGLDVIMSGWGLSNTGKIPEILETVSLKVIPNDECENKAFKLEGVRIPLNMRLICTIANPFALMQNGDSGGPLLYMNEIIAINGGTYPRPLEDFNPEKVNLHFSIDYYKNFIFDIIDNY